MAAFGTGVYRSLTEAVSAFSAEGTLYRPDAGRHYDGGLCLHGGNGADLCHYVPVEVSFCIENFVSGVLRCYHYLQSYLYAYSQSSCFGGRLFYFGFL